MARFFPRSSPNLKGTAKCCVCYKKKIFFYVTRKRNINKEISKCRGKVINFLISRCRNEVNFLVIAGIRVDNIPYYFKKSYLIIILQMVSVILLTDARTVSRLISYMYICGFSYLSAYHVKYNSINIVMEEYLVNHIAQLISFTPFFRNQIKEEWINMIRVSG